MLVVYLYEKYISLFTLQVYEHSCYTYLQSLTQKCWWSTSMKNIYRCLIRQINPNKIVFVCVWGIATNVKFFKCFKYSQFTYKTITSNLLRRKSLKIYSMFNYAIFIVFVEFIFQQILMLVLIVHPYWLTSFCYHTKQNSYRIYCLFVYDLWIWRSFW